MNDMLDDIPDDELRRRLINFEEQPDDDLWNRMKDAIPHQATPLSEQLKQYREEPDASTWNEIVAGVNLHLAAARLEITALVVACISLFLLFVPITEQFMQAEQLLAKDKGMPGLKERASIQQPSGEDISPSHVDSQRSAANAQAMTRKQIDTTDVVKIKTDEVPHSNSIQAQIKKSKAGGIGEIESQGDVRPVMKAEKKKDGPHTAVQDSVRRKTRTREGIAEVPVVGLDRFTDSNADNKIHLTEEDDLTSSQIQIDNRRRNMDSTGLNRLTEQATTIISTDKTESLTTVKKADTITQVNQNSANVSGILPEQEMQADSTVTEHKEAAIARRVETKQSKKKLQQNVSGLYFLVMPTLGYQEVKPLKNDNIFIESVEKLSAFSPKRLGIRGEIGFEKAFVSGWAVNAGALFYQRKQTISYQYNESTQVEVVQVPGETISYAVKPQTLSSTFEYEVRNIGMLVGASYSIAGKKFTQRVGMSGELHKALSGEISSNHLYLFANAYYRVSTRLSHRFDLMFQPTFNYSLQVDDRLNAPFYVKPYGLGLNFGVYYHLSK